MKPPSEDPHNLKRFVDAQDPVFDQVCSELINGKKRTHWIWFIFPQISGLGHSEMAKRYAISCNEEAEAYISHQLLEKRLRVCTRLVLNVDANSIEEILGTIDGVKFRSSMTLFARIASKNHDFEEALRKYFNGEEDNLTVQKLQL